MSVTAAHALSVPASFDSIAQVRTELVTLLLQQSWPDDCRQRVVLAGSEAVINAIEHGSRRDAEVRVEIEVNGTTTRLRVTDGGCEGSSVPSLDAQTPPPTAIRGRGLAIMRHMSDRAEIRASGGETVVVLEFDRQG